MRRGVRVPASVWLAGTTYGWFLVLLPGRLRRRSRAMEAMFEALAREAWEDGGAGAVWRRWLGAVADALVCLPFEYTRVIRVSGSHRFERGVVMLMAAHFVSDLRIAGRSLRRRPAVALMAVLTLGVGIGAGTAVFSLVWGSWLKPLPYPDANQLVLLTDRHASFEPGKGGSTMSIGDYWTLKGSSRLVESMAAFSPGRVAWGSEGRSIPALWVEAGFFHTLRLPVVVGREFDAADADAGNRVVILSHRLWKQEFGGDRSVVGRNVMVNGETWTVIGVADPDFDFRWTPDVIGPLGFTAAQKSAHGGRMIRAIGRIAPGVSTEAARSELQSIYAGIAERHPEGHDGWTAWASSLRAYVVGEDHVVLVLMGAAAALLLLITLVNVANLMLTRTEGRQQEVAVRLALGASRGRVIGTFMSESLAVGLLGGLAGIAVAYGGIRVLVAIFGTDLRRPLEIGLNGATLATAFTLTLAISILVGLVSAARSGVREPMAQLRSATIRGSANTGLRRVLVMSEIVLAVVLVCGAGLLVNTVWRLTHADLGFQPDRAVAASLELPAGLTGNEQALQAFYRQLLEALDRHPAIAAAAVTDRIPPDDNITANGVRAAGHPETSTDFVVVRRITAGYFAAAGIPIVEGTSFDGWIGSVDNAGLLPIVINRPLADALFAGRSAVGGELDGGGRVVGVVGAVREAGADAPAPPALYLPWPATAGSPTRGAPLILRAATDVRAVAPALREVLAGLEPDAKFSAHPVSDRIGLFYWNQQFAGSLMSLFAAVALVLGAIGIYGVLSWTVAQRTREVGLRIALGADRQAVIGMVVRQGFRLAVLGILLGLVLAGGLSRFLSSLLFGVSGVDPLTYAGVTALFLLTAGLACWVPALRASRIQPTEALRAE